MTSSYTNHYTTEDLQVLSTCRRRESLTAGLSCISLSTMTRDATMGGYSEGLGSKSGSVRNRDVYRARTIDI
jgi:hypothetical protein